MGVVHLPARPIPRVAHRVKTAVNKFTGGFDGGGGFSTLFETPDYQAAQVAQYVKSDAAPSRKTFDSSKR